jgi:hypothetical protein
MAGSELIQIALCVLQERIAKLEASVQGGGGKSQVRLIHGGLQQLASCGRTQVLRTFCC